MMGWDDEAFLQSAVDTCTDPSGKIQDCPLFNIQSEDDQRACKIKIPDEIKNEQVAGVVGGNLPGKVAVHYGPGPAIPNKPAPTTPPAPVVVPTVEYSAGATATGDFVLPGQIFKETKTGGGANALAAPAPTTAPSEPSVDDGFSIVRTEYITEGNVVNKVVVKEAVEYVTVTTTTVVETIPKKRHAAHLHKHRRHGH